MYVRDSELLQITLQNTAIPFGKWTAMQCIIPVPELSRHGTNNTFTEIYSLVLAQVMKQGADSILIIVSVAKCIRGDCQSALNQSGIFFF